MECGENYKELFQPVESAHRVHIVQCAVQCICSVLLQVYFCYFRCSGSVEWGSGEARAANDVCPQLK